MTPDELKRLSETPVVPSTGMNPPHLFAVINAETGARILEEVTPQCEEIMVRHVFIDDQGRRCTRYLGPLLWKRSGAHPEGSAGR